MLVFSQIANLPANTARVFCDPILSCVSLAVVDSGAELIGACVWPRAAPLSQARLLISTQSICLTQKLSQFYTKSLRTIWLWTPRSLPDGVNGVTQLNMWLSCVSSLL